VTIVILYIVREQIASTGSVSLPASLASVCGSCGPLETSIKGGSRFIVTFLGVIQQDK